MKKIVAIIFCLVMLKSNAQFKGSISVIDFVKIKNDRKPEALYFYENNWKVYRDMALQKGFIRSYKLLMTTGDSTAAFDIMLITEYTDTVQSKQAEARFQQIIKETRPGGPKLLNSLMPNDFRQNVFSKTTETLFEPIP